MRLRISNDDSLPPAIAGESGHVLGRIGGATEGPVVVVMAGIHGNEPAGLKASIRVLRYLERRKPAVRGKLIMLRGNLAALNDHTRYVDEDLNRSWIPQRIAVIRARGDGRWRSVEEREQSELLDLLEEIPQEPADGFFFLDLHTSSADGPPFLTVGDTLRNLAFARKLPLPLILGLEEQVDGSLLEYLNNSGFTTLGIEAGQHDRDESVERQEAVLWLALVGSGFLQAEDAPDLAQHRQLLEDVSRGLPRVVEVRRRHAIEEEEQFRMEPGFSNFQWVEKGRLLARDQHGLVLAPDHGRILLPLYHGKGSDGFFLARDVRPFWLSVSAMMRRLRLANLLRMLPGVKRHSDDRDVLVLNDSSSHRYPLELFHMLGFRKLRRSGNDILLCRRRFDLVPPPHITSV
jgi:succinylglutamate desuccinylase